MSIARYRNAALAVLLVLLVTMSTGCAEFFDIADLAVETALADSPDPEVQATGRAMQEQREEAKAEALVAQFLATGDREHLREALAVRPNDVRLVAYQYTDAVRDKDGDGYEAGAARRAIVELETQRLKAERRARGLDTRLGPVERRLIEINANTQILVASSKMIVAGPPIGSSEQDLERHRQWVHEYCRGRAELSAKFPEMAHVLAATAPCPEG